MDERRRAELLVIRLRWIALISCVLVIDDYGATPAPILGVIFTVFLYNALASHVATDKSLFARWGNVLAPATRCLDLAAILLATRASGPQAGNLYLLYGFVIVGTGYAYNRISAILLALLASLTLDSISITARVGLGDGRGLITQHAAAYLASSLIATYIIAFRKQDESMRMKERKLSALFESGTRFRSAQDLNQLLEHVLNTAISETLAAGGSIMAMDENDRLVQKLAKHKDGEPSDKLRDLEAANWVVSTAQPLFVDPGSAGEAGGLNGASARSIICVPLTERNTSEGFGMREGSNGRVIGTLSVYSDRQGPSFGQEDLDLLRMLALHASMGMVNARLYRDLHDTFLKTLQSLARSLEARDPYTQGHSYRVSEIAQLVAAELALPPERREILRNAALLHDIGKIGVPDSVLEKPGRLTAEERLVIQTHPITGENICRPLDLEQEVLFLIRHHQERLNGSGYPDQLPADEQPLPLRILCAVDALDAMSSDRPYRKALSAAERVEQLNKAAGYEFDPVVVEVLKSLLNSGVLDRFYTRSEDDDMLKAA